MKKLACWIKRHRKIAVAAALAFVVYAGIAVLLTWPLATAPNRYYFSPEVPGDGAGIIAESWYSDYARQTGMKGYTTKFYGYPFGVYRRGAPVYPLDNGLRNQLTRVIGAQAASSVIIMLSFPLAGLFMFLLVCYLTKSRAASFVAGFLYAFSPWHTARAFDQVSLTAIFTLPLFLLALIVFSRRKDVPGAIGLAVAWIVAFYSDFHFGLFCSLIALVWVIALYVRRWRVGAGLWVRNSDLKATPMRTLVLAVLVILVTVAAVAPYISDTYYKDPNVFSGTGRGGVQEAAGFSSNPWNYVVPPAHALAWRWFTDAFVSKRLGLRTTNEVTAYPGIITLALALTAMFFALRRRRSREGGIREAEPGNDLRLVIWFGVALVAVAFALSLPPQYVLGSVKIPTPSMLVNLLVPAFRYYARWAVEVTFGLCMLAGLGFYLLTRSLKWGRVAVWVACVAVVALFALDVTIIPPLRSTDAMSKQPDVIKRLAAYPEDQAVAIYPLVQGSEYAALHYRYLQQFHKHPMLNGVKPATESDLYRLAMKDIYAPYTPSMLKGLGIDKVVVLSEYFSNKDYGNYPYGVPFDPARMPEGYELVDKTADGYIYDVVAEPASVYPLYFKNFTPPSVLSDGTAWAAMLKPAAEVLLVNRGSRGSYSLTYTINNPGPPGRLTFSLDGEELTSVGLNSGNTRVTLPGLELTNGRHSLGLHWDGKPQVVDGTPFRAGPRISVYLLFSNVDVNPE